MKFKSRQDMDAWVLAKPDSFNVRLLVGSGRWEECPAKSATEAEVIADSMSKNFISQRKPIIYAVRVGESETFGAVYKVWGK